MKRPLAKMHTTKHKRTISLSELCERVIFREANETGGLVNLKIEQPLWLMRGLLNLFE